jgi:fructose-1,6-bisphosphatase/inositol monophosphatase family enzyme
VPTLSDEPLDRISVCTYLHPNRFDDADQFEPWRAVITATATVRMLGSASIDLAGVAGGRSGLFLQRNLHLWDWLPGAALVRGAGGAAEIVPHRGQHWNLAGSHQAVAEATARILAS